MVATPKYTGLHYRQGLDTLNHIRRARVLFQHGNSMINANKPLAMLVISLALGSLNASALATSCADICSAKGYSGSYCDGTAPFCDGQDLVGIVHAHNASYDVIDGGHCTDGSSCWTGHKECTCFHKLTDEECQAKCEEVFAAYIGDCDGGDPVAGEIELAVCNISGNQTVTYCQCH